MSKYRSADFATRLRLPVLVTLFLYGGVVFAETPVIETPKFTVPAQSFATPIQTGKAARARAEVSGVYKPSVSTGGIFCAGAKLPRFDDGNIFVRAVDDFYEGGSTVWTGALKFEGAPGSIPAPRVEGRVDRGGGFFALCRTEHDEDFQHNYLKGVAPNWYFGETENIVGTRHNKDGERIANPVTVTVSVPRPTALGKAKLSIALNSDAPPGKPNALTVTINGTKLFENFAWDGSGYRIIHCDVDGSVLHDGDNFLELIGDSDYIKHLDWVEIDALAEPQLRRGSLVVSAEADVAVSMPGTQFAVDITDFGREKSVPLAAGKYALSKGRLYFFGDTARPLAFGAEETLAHAKAGCDYLSVATRESLPALAPLLNKKRAGGLKTNEVAFEDALAVYNGGMNGPEALLALIKDVKPKYVLIAGGFDRDCRRRQENHQKDPVWQRGIPAYMRQLEQLTVTDDPFTLDNTVKVGRVPLNDGKSLGAWATKAARYVAPDAITLLAGTNKDWDFSASQERQGAGGFAAVLKAEDRPKEDVRHDLFALMKAGARLGIYQGHAQSWEIDKGLLDGSHAAEMPESSWVLATCNAGYYQGDFKVYLRDWMGAAEGGCVNALAPASIGTAGDQDQLVRQFLFYLHSEPDADWGGAMNYLKRNLPFNEKTMRDPQLPDFVRKSIEADRLTIDAYSMFGDPAARVLSPAARTATFEVSKGNADPAVTLTIGKQQDAKTLSGGSLGLQWRMQDDKEWHALEMAGKLKVGDNPIVFTSKTTGTDGGSFDLQLAERHAGLPPIVWATTKVSLESEQPGVPEVMFRPAPKRGADAPGASAIVFVARSKKVVHRGQGIETQFQIRVKNSPGGKTQESDWQPQPRYRFETTMSAEQLEARAHWRKNGVTGEWSEWFTYVPESTPGKGTPEQAPQEHTAPETVTP